MNWKELLYLGCVGVAIHTIMLIPSLLSDTAQGVLLLVACVLFALRYLVVRGPSSDDGCETLCDVMMLLFMLLLMSNSISLMCSDGQMWTSTIAYSLFWPIVLSGFIGTVRKDSLIRGCSLVTMVFCVTWCGDNEVWTGSLNLLAVVSYVACLIFPAIVLWWRTHRSAVTE